MLEYPNGVEDYCGVWAFSYGSFFLDREGDAVVLHVCIPDGIRAFLMTDDHWQSETGDSPIPLEGSRTVRLVPRSVPLPG